MKVLIPTTDKIATLDSIPSRIFGSAKSFVIYNTDNNSFTSIENTLYNTDEHIIANDLKKYDIDNIITENICSDCYNNLTGNGIDIWTDNKSMTVREAYQKFALGGLFVMINPGKVTMHKINKIETEKRLKIKQAH